MTRNKIVRVYFLSFLLLCVFGIATVVHAQTGGGQPLVVCGETDPTTCDFQKLYILINNIWTFLLREILFPLAILSIMFAGFKYVMARGNPGEIQKAHDVFYYVVVGIVIAFAAWLIVKAILSGIGASIDFLG